MHTARDSRPMTWRHLMLSYAEIERRLLAALEADRIPREVRARLQAIVTDVVVPIMRRMGAPSRRLVWGCVGLLWQPPEVLEEPAPPWNRKSTGGSGRRGAVGHRPRWSGRVWSREEMVAALRAEVPEEAAVEAVQQAGQMPAEIVLPVSPAVAKERACLRCRNLLLSAHTGNRICVRCVGAVQSDRSAIA